MKNILLLLYLTGSCFTLTCSAQNGLLNVDYLGFAEKIPFPPVNIDIKNIHNDEAGITYLESVLTKVDCGPLLEEMNRIRIQKKLDDWFFYQLIRRVAQQIVPKKENYLGYTYCKWLLLKLTGYAPLLRLSPNKVLLYVMSNDSTSNIPYLMREGQQFVCLNYHDYSYQIDFEQEKFKTIKTTESLDTRPFSYQITRIPDFSPACYDTKKISFIYNGNEESFTVPMNPQMLTYFTNYPVIDYRYQFSIPLSSATYSSLIPQLKKRLQEVSTTEGVEYLMYLVRYAFAFQRDSEKFGLEKRFSPEETLVAEKSDCEDRSALFFALVKEVYQLPMIVLSYPEHVTVAVELKPSVGHPINYNGKIFTLCEPTPQKRDLALGELMPHLKFQQHEVVLLYDPEKKLILSTGQ